MLAHWRSERRHRDCEAERNGQVLTLQAIDPIAQRSRRPANFSMLDWLTVERTAIGHTFKGR
jgi:hypothetical protein